MKRQNSRHPANLSAAGTAAIAIGAYSKLNAGATGGPRSLGPSVSPHAAWYFSLWSLGVVVSSRVFPRRFIERWLIGASAVPIFCNSLWAMTQFPFDLAKSLLTNWSIDVDQATMSQRSIWICIRFGEFLTREAPTQITDITLGNIHDLEAPEKAENIITACK
jgi:hypothetical protein